MGAPVGNTCPDIDYIINAIKTSETLAKDFYYNLKDKTIDEIEDSFRDMHHELSDLESKLEELRDANSALRSWGETLEEENNELINELEKVNG